MHRILSCTNYCRKSYWTTTMRSTIALITFSSLPSRASTASSLLQPACRMTSSTSAALSLPYLC